MEFGNKILELRKKAGLSQEQLAEQMGVARQTISKWELGETAPDIEESRKLSKIFNISLDDLTNNDVKNVLVDKVSKTEKVSNTIIKILKIILLSIIILVILLVSDLYFREYFTAKPVSATYILECNINGETFEYQTKYKPSDMSIINFYTNDKNMAINYKDYDNPTFLIEDIIWNVKSRGGNCQPVR